MFTNDMYVSFLLLSFQECMGAEVVESACVVGVPELIKVTHSKLVR